MFRNLPEANAAFERLIRELPQHTGREADGAGPYRLYVYWTLAPGFYPLTLEVRRHNSAPPYIELLCGYRNLVTGAEEGQWCYYCEETLPPGKFRPIGNSFTVFDTWDALVAALIEDVRMYLDGSYKTSDVRPRSQVKQ